jgi:hypothetical protein
VYLTRNTWVAIYVTTSAALILLIAYTHIYMCRGRTIHSVPHYLMPSLSSITTPYESQHDGTLATCAKTVCGGRFKPPTTHHCSLCGVCRVGFDHHCPWLANCVTRERVKPFLLLLGLTAFTVPTVLLPIRHELARHVCSALAASRADAFARAYWWDGWWSWIFVGGPPGRWIVGTMLGFRILRRGRGETAWFDGSFIVLPHMRLALLVGAASLLCVFTLVSPVRHSWYALL